MTEIPNQSSRLDRIEALLERVAEQQANLGLRQADTQNQLDNLSHRQADTQNQLDAYIDTATSVLARSAVLDGVVMELRESTENLQRGFEQHQHNFEEHQRTTNAALASLEAILLQLVGRLS
jgi:chromosome segregation ATPase